MYLMSFLIIKLLSSKQKLGQMFFIKNKNIYMNCILVTEWNLRPYAFLYIKKKYSKKVRNDNFRKTVLKLKTQCMRDLTLVLFTVNFLRV